MTAHELAQPLRDLADGLSALPLPLSDPANLCVAAAHELDAMAGRIADLEFRVAQDSGTARPFAPRGKP